MMLRYLDSFNATQQLSDLQVAQLGNGLGKKDANWKKAVDKITQRAEILNKDLISGRSNLYNKNSNTQEVRIGKKGLAALRQSRIEWLQKDN